MTFFPCLTGNASVCCGDSGAGQTHHIERAICTLNHLPYAIAAEKFGQNSLFFSSPLS